jgi:RNA polymerase sigma-70 factor (ECF subfamily)
MSAVRDDTAAVVAAPRPEAVGRDADFAKIFTEHRARVFGICRQLCRSRADAEDATQEVFVALLRAVPRFRGDSSLATFIHRVAVRVAWKHLSRGPARREEPLDEVSLAARTGEDAAAARERERRLRAALDRLSVEQRTVVGLFAVEGMTHREIAATLGVPEGTVWSRLCVARKRLAALLG